MFEIVEDNDLMYCMSVRFTGYMTCCTPIFSDSLSDDNTVAPEASLQLIFSARTSIFAGHTLTIARKCIKGSLIVYRSATHMRTLANALQIKFGIANCTCSRLSNIKTIQSVLLINNGCSAWFHVGIRIENIWL